MSVSTWNETIVCGYLGKDPEIRYSQQSNTKVANYSLSNNRKQGDNEITDWFDVTAFGKGADFVEKFLHKGTPIIVKGELQTQSWTDKTTGQKRTKTFIVAREHKFVGGNTSEQTNTTSADGFMNIDPNDSELLPFV